MKHSSHAAENQHVTLCRCLLQFLLLFCTQLMRRTSLSKRLENHTKTLLLSDVLPPIFTSPELLQFLQRLAAALLIGMLFSVPASGGQPVNYAAARPRLSNLGPDEQFSRETGGGERKCSQDDMPNVLIHQLMPPSQANVSLRPTASENSTVCFKTIKPFVIRHRYD